MTRNGRRPRHGERRPLLDLMSSEDQAGPENAPSFTSEACARNVSFGL
jgi:hypothetical protein